MIDIEVAKIERDGYLDSPVFVSWCDCCDKEIYKGEAVYEIYGVVIHEDCLRKWAQEYSTVAV